MSRHSESGRGGLSRREFLLKAGATGVALPSLAAILAACKDSSSSTATATASGQSNPYGSGGVPGAPYPLARTDAQVTWAIPDDYQPIASGLAPEAGATL